jgi:hypothetical protein
MKKLLILAALLAVALLAACGSASAPEEAPKPAETQTAWVDDSNFAYPGLHLEVYDPPFEGLRCLAAEANADGSYLRRDMTEDGQLLICQSGGVPAWEDGKDPEEYLLAAATALAESGDVSSPFIEQNEEYSASMTYPVYIASFDTGANEDTRSWKVFAMDTDSGAFLYGLSVPADGAENLESLAADVFGHLTLVEPGMDIAPQEETLEAQPGGWEGDSIVYESPFGWSITMPASWEGRYLVAEEGDSEIVCAASSHDGENQGALFTIMRMDAADADELAEMVPVTRLAEMEDGTRYIAVFPSDVQFKPEFAEDYQDMYKDVESIVGTFTMAPQGQ